MFISRSSVVFSWICGYIAGGWKDYFYRLVLFSMLFCFLALRMPYLYGMSGFGLFLFVVIFPIFLGLFGCRVFDVGVVEFFSSFVPPSTPLWIAPFVCLAETLSYLVRPVVLMIRPFVNLSMGVFGGYALGLMCFGSFWVSGFLFFLFFYEVFVAVVHWFIVSNILSFSEDH